MCCTNIFLYADDVILLSPSVHALQMLVNICVSELDFLDMAVNAMKSACLRFGDRYKSSCANVITAGGQAIDWVSSARYLGVFLESSSKFRCSFSANKAGFYRAFNSIFGKVGRNASEEVLFQLIKSKCLPILYYGIDACPANSTTKQSLEFTMNRIMFKIFGAMSRDAYREVCKYFGICSVDETVRARQDKFVTRYCSTDNILCQVISGM
jgi:hypothetical protein